MELLLAQNPLQFGYPLDQCLGFVFFAFHLYNHGRSLFGDAESTGTATDKRSFLKLRRARKRPKAKPSSQQLVSFLTLGFFTKNTTLAYFDNFFR
jgi:hypothetical protein